MANEMPELDEIDGDDEALTLTDHALEQALADGRAWSEDDEDGTVPDDLDDDGEGVA